MISIANRLKQTEEYYFSIKLREIAQMISNGMPVINLGIGSPDLIPPKSAIQKLIEVGQENQSHAYQSYKGIPALREAFAGWYKKQYKVDLNAESEILPLIGSKEGITHISMTYLNEGDQVLVPNPGYPAYSAASRLAGAEVLSYDLLETNDWLPDFNLLESLDLSKIKIMWVNYPNMPTGKAASKDLLQKLVAFGKKHRILICNDNPYSFILNDNPLSILSVEGSKEVCLELNSLSKSHNMAGWRMGMLAGDKAHIENVLKFKSNVDSGMFLPIQEAAIAALKQDNSWYKNQNDTYSTRRDLVFKIMDSLECTYNRKQSGMFVWARVSDDIADVNEWINTILHHAHVFITPGHIFGSNGERYVRISLCNPETRLLEVLKRVQKLKFLKS